VAQACDTGAVMYAGQIVEIGPMEALYHEPDHPYTRALFAATPDLYGDHPVASIAGSPPHLNRPIVGCAFRDRCPDAIEVCVRERPVPQVMAVDHLAACHRAGEIARPAS